MTHPNVDGSRLCSSEIRISSLCHGFVLDNQLPVPVVWCQPKLRHHRPFTETGLRLPDLISAERSDNVGKASIAGPLAVRE